MVMIALTTYAGRRQTVCPESLTFDIELFLSLLFRYASYYGLMICIGIECQAKQDRYSTALVSKRPTAESAACLRARYCTVVTAPSSYKPRWERCPHRESAAVETRARR